MKLLPTKIWFLIIALYAVYLGTFALWIYTNNVYGAIMTGLLAGYNTRKMLIEYQNYYKQKENEKKELLCKEKMKLAVADIYTILIKNHIDSNTCSSSINIHDNSFMLIINVEPLDNYSITTFFNEIVKVNEVYIIGKKEYIEVNDINIIKLEGILIE